MSRLTTSFLLEREVAESALRGMTTLKHSTARYHWLGRGTYFWDSDAQRALEWAQRRPGKRALKEPFVLGAIIDMRNSLDLRGRGNVDLVRQAYDLFAAETAAAGMSMPRNQEAPNDKSPDKVMRYLDFAVIERLHQMMVDLGREPFDTVRALFHEGLEIYEGSGFRDKTHSEIAVRNDECILGYFIPRAAPVSRT